MKIKLIDFYYVYLYFLRIFQQKICTLDIEMAIFKMEVLASFIKGYILKNIDNKIKRKN